jgi:septal ring factor EnvC (AmiA/AmiB activator)
MEAKVYNIKDLHFEHRIWKGEMKIILGELNIYQEWLSCMSVKSQNVEFQKNIDYFQNKFDIQRNHFDSFNDRINAQESFVESLEREDKELNSKTIADNTNLRADINIAVKIYNELKEEYKTFCSGVKF